MEGAREEIRHHTGLDWLGTEKLGGGGGVMRATVWLGGTTPHELPNDPSPSVPEWSLLLPSGKAQKSLSGSTHPMHVLTFQKITERFFRNPEKPADEDVAERVFLIPEERIQLRYHCRDDHITASKREFLRRTEVDNKGNKIIMTPDMCISFEVGLGARRGEKKLGSSAPSL